MRNALLILFVIPLIGYSQNGRVDWWVLDMGSASSAVAQTKLQSAVGQNFVGLARQGNAMVTPGFLADTLFRSVVVSVAEDEDDVPLTYELRQNYPNPFNPTTIIRYQLPLQSYVTLKVFDILGRDVATLVNEVKQPGTYSVQWHASGVASGVYFCRLQAGQFSAMKKMVLMR